MASIDASKMKKLQVSSNDSKSNEEDEVNVDAMGKESKRIQLTKLQFHVQTTMKWIHNIKIWVVESEIATTSRILFVQCHSKVF